MSPAGAHKAVRRGRELIADEIRDAAEELRASEAAKLTALHDAFMPAALDGDVHAADIVLKTSREFRKLNALDLERETGGGSGITVINTALPPEVLAGEIVDEELSGELGAGAQR